MLVRLYVYQFHLNDEFLVALLYTASQDGHDPQPPAVLCVHVAAPKAKTRVARQDSQRSNSGNAVQNGLGEAVTQILGGGSAAEGGKRQNRQRAQRTEARPIPCGHHGQDQ